MDLTTLKLLLTPPGQAVLAEAAAIAPTDASLLRAVEMLRKRHEPELAQAALETTLLRDRARAKFTDADRLYFTRDALEQSSGEAAAQHRADRFRQFETVLDLCCGIGADALQLAAAGCRVEAIDADPLRLAMAEANAAALGLAECVHAHLGDVLSMRLPVADAAFVDPSRREGERRFLSPDRYQPPLGEVLTRFPPGFPIAAKIAPGVAWSDLTKWDAEVEFVSVSGELKECVLWFGPLRSAARRATVLPSGATLTGAGPASDPPSRPPGAYVFDPDPAVIRAGLTGLLAEQLGAAPVDPGVAFLTGSTAIESPLARCFAVEHAAPFHLGRLRDFLRERQVGRVTLLKRAVELDADEVQRKLKLSGADHRVVILVRSQGRPWAVVSSAQLAQR